MRTRRFVLALFALFALSIPSAGCLGAAPVAAQQAQQAEFVIHISVDGLRPDAITALGPTALPNLYRLRTQGAFTDNARDDYDFTVTLPNHITQLTGRGVMGDAGHGWTLNADPKPGDTIQSNKGSYVASVFDVAHDNGLRTGCYASKTKFSLFSVSYSATSGAPDVAGPDNGRAKIDIYVRKDTSADLVKQFRSDAAAKPFQYVFIHLNELDSTGHAKGWDPTPGSDYSNALKNAIDPAVGQVLRLIDTDARLTGKTVVILTADHGGKGKDHADATLREDYTVPFYVWGPGVKAGADLYALNPKSRLDPATGRPKYAASVQPIRNGEAANLALKLLGLPPVPGSTINAAQDLIVGPAAREANPKAVKPAPTSTARPVPAVPAAQPVGAGA